MAGVKRNLAANLYATAAVTGGQLVLVPLFLGCWGQSYYGEWLVLSAVPAYLALSDIGIGNALGNEFSIAVERGQHGRAQDILGSAWRFQTWFSLVLAVLVMLVVALLPLQSWLRSTAISPLEFVTVLLLLTAYALLPLQAGIFSGVYRAAHAYPRYLRIQGHVRVLEILGTAVLLWVRAGMAWLAVLLVLLRVVMLLFLMGQSKRLLPALTLRWTAGTWRDFRSLLPASAGFFGFPVGAALINQGVTLAVNSAGGAAAVVSLSVCRQVGRVFLQVSSILFTSLHPELTTAYAQRNSPRMLRLQAGALGLTLVLGAFFAAGAFGLGGWVVQVWTGLTTVPDVVVGFFALEAVTAALANLALIVPWATSRLGMLPVVYLMVQLLSLVVSWVAFPHLGVGVVGATFLLGNVIFGGVALARSLGELDSSLRSFLHSGWSGLGGAASDLIGKAQHRFSAS